jgi:probable addiction module antidote protein
MKKPVRKLKTTEFDAASYLDTPEAVSAYLDDIFESGDAALVAHGLGVAARAQGMAKIAKKAGLSRESLYKALSTDGNPEFGTVLRVMKALDVRLGVRSQS